MLIPYIMLDVWIVTQTVEDTGQGFIKCAVRIKQTLIGRV